jgi:DMSO reductase anchor subunit
LTQLAVGAFSLELFITRLSGTSLGDPLLQAAFACLLALLALGASVLHLGRPLLAWRAVIGLRTSWLSREAVALGLFAKLALVYAGLAALPLLPEFPHKELLATLTPTVQMLAAGAGALGVFCSVMVYVATKREQWSGATTGIKFFGTTLILGGASVFAVAQLTNAELVLDRGTSAVLWFVMAASLVKLAYEGRGLLHARDRRHSIAKRMARVMLKDLKYSTALRFCAGALGGLLLPLVFLHVPIRDEIVPFLATLMLATLAAAELAERYLFFRAAPASRMPGGLK